MRKKIIIFDDEEKSADSWKADLEALETVKSKYDVTTVVDSEFYEALEELEERRRRIREGQLFRKPLGENLFDQAAILIVDYDLLYLKQDATQNAETITSNSLTGESVSYIARCFSTCGPIVALNQYGFNTFDLTLKGHPESFADLNLGGKQIHNPGLWSEGWTGFRPWMWPLLPLMEQTFGRRIRDLQDHLDSSILRYLEFPEDIAPILPRAISQFLDLGKATNTPIEEVTFRDFAMKSENGYRGKDASYRGEYFVYPDELLARVAAARIAKWLERLVLPGQDILVDTPHLVQRYPSLLDEDSDKRKRIEIWNASASLETPHIRHNILSRHEFKRKHWLSRPAWWFASIRNDETIDEIAAPWDIERSDYVFCEDISRFLPEEESQEFVADLPSPYTRRFAVDPERCRDHALVAELRMVDYRPQVRFSL